MAIRKKIKPRISAYLHFHTIDASAEIRGSFSLDNRSLQGEILILLSAWHPSGVV